MEETLFAPYPSDIRHGGRTHLAWWTCLAAHTMARRRHARSTISRYRAFESASIRSSLGLLLWFKKAAARANHQLGDLSEEKMNAIGHACDDIAAGHLSDQFALDVFQGGAGTSTNMNMNEVIANRGLEIMGLQRGAYAALHPNNDVNHSQSTNDVYPHSGSASASSRNT